MRLAIGLVLCCGFAAAQMNDISGARMRAHVKFLASDLMEGRGVGTRGGELATDYLATQLELIGAKPAGDNGTYFQRVPLVGVTTLPSATLQSGSTSFRWLDEFVGTTQTQQPEASFDAEAVFVGHGITAPEFGWNDYEGADVRGKVVVLFTNEPPSADPKFFGARALTYYGRWTYKYEQATRMGAIACLIIHTTPTAGYSYDVVRSSWGREDTQVALKPGDPALKLAAWLSQEAAAKMLAGTNWTVESLLKQADTKGFKAFPLNMRFRASVPSKVRQIESRNVAGLIAGSDATLKSEAVIFSAHWDHLGMGEPVNGDTIRNGAVDNATGCALVLELAHAWQSLPQKPKRSALFLFVTAEEGGLRGSEFYGKNPLIPAGKTALALNFDAYYPFGRTTDVVVAGSERTTAYPLVEEAAKRMNLTIQPDPHPEQGSYYRSDHFSLAKAGIPAFSINMGTKFAGKPPEFGEQLFKEFNAKHYHQPSDEYHEDWDFSGVEEMARFGFLIGVNAANSNKLPTWRAGDEFLAAREKSGVR